MYYKKLFKASKLKADDCGFCFVLTVDNETTRNDSDNYVAASYAFLALGPWKKAQITNAYQTKKCHCLIEIIVNWNNIYNRQSKTDYYSITL